MPRSWPRGNPSGPATPSGAHRPRRAAIAANSVAVEWRVVGVVTTETDGYLTVLIRKPGEKSPRHEIRHPGDDLPTERCPFIEPTAVTVDRQGTIVRIKMFAQN